MSKEDYRIKINVSGNIFETKQSTLDRFPNTLLSRNSRDRNTFYCPQTQQYYFNRDRKQFEAILFFYQSCGKLYLPAESNSLEDFIEECKFFRLPEEAIDLLKLLEGEQLLKDVKQASRFVRPPPAITVIDRLRNVIEYPNSSIVAKILAVVYALMISGSIYRGCFETLPGGEIYTTQGWVYYEVTVSGFLLLEFLLRTILNKDHKALRSNPFTYVDMVTILSYESVNFLVNYNNDLQDTAASIAVDLPALARFLKALQFLRIIRFLRFGKMSRRVSIVYVIVKDSAKDLQYFIVCLLVIVTTTGSIVYFMENSGDEDPPSMDSIPESMWWSLQAYLTIGYGDVIPVTLPGKIFSGFYMAVGILTLMLPMLSLILKLVKCTKEINLDEKENSTSSDSQEELSAI